MAKGKNQKKKTIKILEILRNETDADHPMSTPELIERLNAEGIDAERKALYDDIKILQECGFEIFCERGISNKYYIDEKTLEAPEVRILIDAVHSAKFITEKKTNELTAKLSLLAGKNEGERLTSNLQYFDRAKHTNESIFYNVDALNDGIDKKCKVSFKYFDYDVNGEKVFRKKGVRYVVNPINLIFSADNYYLITYNEKYNNVSHYRVDRMVDVEIEENMPRVDLPEAMHRDMPKYHKRMFSMFGGKEQYVELIIEKSLIDTVFDKFGSDARLTWLDDTKISVKTEVAVSTAFFGWVASFGNKMKIASPMSVQKKMIEHLKNALNSYETT